MRELLEDVPDGLEHFLSRWFGPAAAPPADDRDTRRLPPALQEWYRTASRWPGGVIHQNTFREPDKIVEWDGKMVFLSDWDGDLIWGYDPRAEGEPVSVREGGDGRWEPLDLSLRRFLVLNVAVELALLGPLSLWSWQASEEEADRVRAAVPSVPHGPLRWPLQDARLHATDDVLALVAPSPNMPPDLPPAFTVHLVARNPVALDGLGLTDPDRWFRRP